ncbi:MAG TPA: hypothetical protein VD948_12245, partial [Rhodothermales bacterium]|nr:hypothetical protein [Rhodothermales bacterium]
MRISILPTGCLLALRLGLLAVLLGFVWGAPAGAQNVVHHVDPSFDDGVPERDADGVKNGVVVWAAGKVHVLTSYGVGSWFVGNNMVRGILVIQPGA